MPLRTREKLLKYGVNGIALLFGVALLIASVLEIGQMFRLLYQGQTNLAVQDGLFVLILLEMFFVVYMFIKQGTINIGLIINIGIVAVIKEMIFQLNDLTLSVSLAFAVLFLSLLGGVFMERNNYFSKTYQRCCLKENEKEVKHRKRKGSKEVERG